MAEIKLINVTKKFAEKGNAIENLTLEINDGEFVVLLGGTGSGKSSILRMIAGLDEITSGELLIDGVLSNELQPKDRNIAMIFQNHQLMPHLSVYDNIAFGLKLRKITPEEINIKIREVAKILGIENSLSKKPKSLSSLERQRVVMARAVVREPNVCLFDEILSSLDDALTKRVRSELVKLQYRMKQTFIFATCDQIDALSMATRLVIMNSGKIEQIGTPQEIYETPKTAYVATYVGAPQINLAAADLVKNGDDIFVEMLGIKIKLSQERVEKIEKISDYSNTKKGLTAAIRAENISVCNDGYDLMATAETVEDYGEYKSVTLKLDNKPISDWTILLKSEETIEKGKELKLKLDSDKIHLFDRETEVTIFR